MSAATVSREQAREQWLADKADDRVVFQRVYAGRWGVSVGTANAWIKAFRGLESAESNAESTAEPTEQRTEPELNRAESTTESGLNSAEPRLNSAEFSAELNAIQAQLNAISRDLSVLAKNYSKLFQELTPLLASLGEGAFSSVQPLNSVQTELNAELNRGAEPAEQPHLLPPSEEDRLRLSDRRRTRLLNLISKRPTPKKRDGTSYASNEAWLEDQWPVIAAKVMADAGGETLTDKAFDAKTVEMVMRFARSTPPPTARSARAPVRREAGSWQNG